MSAHTIQDDHDRDVRTLETEAMFGAARLLQHPAVAETFSQAIERRIQASLPPGKTYAEALARAKNLNRRLYTSYEWMMVPEDRRIDELNRFCAALCQGDKECGAELALSAVWA